MRYIGYYIYKYIHTYDQIHLHMLVKTSYALPCSTQVATQNMYLVHNTYISLGLAKSSPSVRLYIVSLFHFDKLVCT